uniref:ZP domain-containing protein n=1 Tax=Podarcis muralis TaxID=64176 RepID=A0A670JMY8_PODMU
MTIDDWSAERESTRYWLGDYLHIQADVEREGDHLPLRLLVDSCVAKQTPEEDASLQYAILDFHGCLVDGRIPDVKSAFKIPRPRLETLQFTIEAFRFSGDIRNLIYIACHLRVVATDKGPDPLNKACSFNSQRSLWLPVEGSEDICNCCETGNCVSSKGWPSTNNPSNRRTSEQREQVTLGSGMGEALGLTPVLKDVHWLPVRLKVLVLTFKALNSLGPVYLKERLHCHRSAQTLRSSSEGLLVVPSLQEVRLQGTRQRAFSVVAPSLWNALPSEDT